MATDWAHGLQLESIKCLTLKGGDLKNKHSTSQHTSCRLSGGMTQLKKKL